MQDDRMNDNATGDVGRSAEVREPIREAAGQGGDLRERVRSLVLDALVKRQADPKAMGQVMRDAVAGLGEGLGQHTTHAGDSLKTAMTGLDEALGKSMYALQMAVEESWENGRRFADADLRSAYDAVRGLEDDLVGTLRSAGDKAQGALKEEFTRLGEHLARNGSDTGTQAQRVLEVLNRDLGGAVADAAQDLRADAREAAGRLSEVTSGILRGLSEAWDSRKA